MAGSNMLMFFLGFAALLLRPAAADLLAFNLSIAATSPYLWYHSDFVKNGNQVQYDPSRTATADEKKAGVDAKYPESQLVVRYPGNQLCMYGSFEPMLNISVDMYAQDPQGRIVSGKFPASADGTSVCVNDLGWKQQTILVISGIKTISHINFTTQLEGPPEAQVKDMVMTNMPLVVDGKLSTDPIFNFKTPDTISIASSGGASFAKESSLDINVPANTSYIVFIGPGGGALNITSNNDWPAWTERDRSVVSYYRQFSDGTIPDSELWMNAMDPSVNNLVTVGDINNYRRPFDLFSVVFYAVKPPSKSSKSSNVGAIAGGAVGGVVGLILLGFLAWYLLRKRKSGRMDNDEFVIEQDQVVEAFPQDTTVAHPYPSASHSGSPWFSPGVSETSSSGMGTVPPPHNAKAHEAYVAPSRPWAAVNAVFSGVRHDSDAGTIPCEELLPPMYNPTWDGTNRGPSAMLPRRAPSSVGYSSHSGSSRSHSHNHTSSTDHLSHKPSSSTDFLWSPTGSSYSSGSGGFTTVVPFTTSPSVISETPFFESENGLQSEKSEKEKRARSENRF